MMHPARLSRRTAPSVKIMGAAAIALLVSANTFANAAENSSRTALSQHACAIVLGLDPSGCQYDTCIRSLDRSLAERDQARLVQTGRSACANKGLQPETPAFAVCVLTAEESR
jgi:hypothetical protein